MVSYVCIHSNYFNFMGSSMTEDFKQKLAEARNTSEILKKDIQHLEDDLKSKREKQFQDIQTFLESLKEYIGICAYSDKNFNCNGVQICILVNTDKVSVSITTQHDNRWYCFSQYKEATFIFDFDRWDESKWVDWVVTWVLDHQEDVIQCVEETIMDGLSKQRIELEDRNNDLLKKVNHD